VKREEEEEEEEWWKEGSSDGGWRCWDGWLVCRLVVVVVVVVVSVVRRLMRIYSIGEERRDGGRGQAGGAVDADGGVHTVVFFSSSPR